MATDGRKVVGYTINRDIPVVTLLKVAIELGEITDMRTTYHPEYHSKTVEIFYFPHTYWTLAPEPTTQVPSTTVSDPILPTTPINQSTAPNGDQHKNKRNNNKLTCRIFCIIPANVPAANIVRTLLEHFTPFGAIEYYNIVNNREHKPTFAYIKYFDPRHAKDAYENVHKMMKAVFA
ncbi:hypothetical protein TKK_0015395 [Trichogramma kaykai]|uniref:RRM domain-containing protein n=1 Tax=Trichogramma kaykai TaxID=54128 RepID=A0ABD2W9P9_9HYME